MGELLGGIISKCAVLHIKEKHKNIKFKFPGYIPLHDDVAAACSVGKVSMVSF